MKKIKILTGIVLAALVMTSCNGLNKMSKDASEVTYNVDPTVLETHAGEVEMTVSGTYPDGYFHKKAIVTITPVLVYEGGEAAFEPMVVQGEDVTENNKVISYEGGTFTHTAKVPYVEGMKQSELVLRITSAMKDKTADVPDMKVADGVIATSTYYWAKGEPMIMEDKFQRVIPESMMADIMFQINSSQVRGSELRGEDLASLKEYMKTVNETENLEFVGTEVSSYASPDGPEDFNETLSGRRGSGSEKYVSRELKRANVDEAQNEGFVTSKTTAEDWDGFQELMEGSEIADKELILRVLSMYQDPVVREREIKNISAAYGEISDDILPQLRRSKITVSANKIGFSDEQIMEYLESNPDTLGIEEALYAATLTEDADAKMKAYELAAKQDPNCVRAVNNIGVLQMEKMEFADAKASFEAAQAINDNDYVRNNLGYAALLSDDVEGAKGYFNSVEAPGKEANAGLGIISIMEANYSDAVNYFGTDASYNGGLAQLLNGDAAAAQTTLDGLDMDSAWLSYLKAVVGAELDNEDYVMNNLRAACEKDAEMKDMAKKDLVFATYAEGDAFKAIVE